MVKKSPEMLNRHIDVDKRAVKKSTFIRLRVPDEFLAEIDKEVASHRGLSRTAWILEAIDETLKSKYEGKI